MMIPSMWGGFQNLYKMKAPKISTVGAAKQFGIGVLFGVLVFIVILLLVFIISYGYML